MNVDVRTSNTSIRPAAKNPDTPVGYLYKRHKGGQDQEVRAFYLSKSAKSGKKSDTRPKRELNEIKPLRLAQPLLYLLDSSQGAAIRYGTGHAGEAEEEVSEILHLAL